MRRKLIGIIKSLIILIVTVLLLGIIGVVSNATIIRNGTIVIRESVTKENITELLSRLDPVQVRDGNLFISIAEHRINKDPNFKSLFCSGHGIRLTSAAGGTDYSTGFEVGKLTMTELGTTETTDSETPLHLLINDGETAFKNDGKTLEIIFGKDEEKDEEKAKEAGRLEAIEKIGKGTTVSYGCYTNGGIKNATPIEAYILAETDNNTNNHSYVQQAWWKTIETGGSTGESGSGEIEIPIKSYEGNDEENFYHVPENSVNTDLYSEAVEFGEYIEAVCGTATPGVNSEGLFDIDYASTVGAIDTSNVNILYNGDTNTYKIGPMNFKYIRRATGKNGERAAVDFCGISGATLKYNDENGNPYILSLNNGFRIVYDHDHYHSERMPNYDKEIFNYQYPYSEEEFYIEVDYSDKIVSIEELAFNLHWMNIGATYEDLTSGYSYVINWEGEAEWNSTVHKDGTHVEGDGYDCELSICHEHLHESYTFTYNIWAKVASSTQIPTQPLINCISSKKIDNICGDGTETIDKDRFIVEGEGNRIEFDWDTPPIDINDGGGGKDPHTISGGGSTEIINVNCERGKGGVKVCAGGWELTTELAGFAWAEGIKYEKGVPTRNNDNKYNPRSNSDGTEDKKLKDIEIKIYKVVYDKVGNTYVENSRTLADVYAKKEYRKDGTIRLLDKYDYRDNKIYTNNKGYYRVFLRIPSDARKTSNQKVSYDVEFIYNGQKYEAVEYLYSTGKDDISEKIEVYRNVAENEKSIDGIISYINYRNDSYALEDPEEREEIDSQFLEVYGDSTSKIDNDKKTKGKAKGNDGIVRGLRYKGKMYSELLEERDDSVTGVNNSNDRIVSELVMEDSDEELMAKYKMKARTSTGSFLLHYANNIYIRHYNGCIITNNLNKFYKYGSEGTDLTYYYPIYEYFHQINLGLMEREGIDISVSKDLYKSQVVVNQQEITYKYNTLIDYENKDNGEYLNTLLEMQKINQKYSLGLYPSDFYYRSSVYKSNPDIGEKISDWKSDSELRMFVTYKLILYNDSETFDVTVNKFSDYYDSSFTLVKEDIKADVLNSEGKKYSKTVAEQPYYRIYSLLESDFSRNTYNYNSKEDLNVSGLKRVKESRSVVNGKISEDSWTTENSSSSAYKRASLTNFKYKLDNSNEKVKESNVILSPGERIELFVTYEVDREGYNSAKNEDYKEPTKRNKLLGGKNNVIEVDNYSSFYTEESIRTDTTAYEPGQIAGKIDDDSAPGNINLSKTITDEDGDRTLNKKWFEDDTESAPIYKIYLRDENNQRQINGKVWIDKKEKRIKNSSGELLDTATGDGILDSDEEGVNGITVSLVEKIRIKGNEDDADTLEYEFIWPSDISSSAMTGYKPVTNTSGSGNGKGTYKFINFPSGIYVVRFEYGNKQETLKYNGQDYENTAYQIDKKNASEYSSSLIENCDTKYQKNESTLNNEWHDIGNNETAKALENDRVSDARDYEPQRLRVIAYSRTISNSNAEVLVNTSNNEELINATAMIANTAKINFEIEKQSEIDYTNYNRETDRTSQLKVVKGVSKKEIEGTDGVNTTTQKYIVKNIDFGLEKRAQTSIQLDKYLKKIVLSKENSSDIILEADITDDEEILFNSENSLNTSKILSMTQSGGVQGFKYITMESNYFNDLTVLLTYRIDVVNESEVDWTSEKLSKVYNDEELYNLADKLEGDYTTDKHKHTALVKGEGISYGEYAGYYYYTNSSIDGTEKISTKPKASNDGITYKDKVVKTTVDQLVDYIDKDTSLASTSKTLDKNNSWKDNFNYESYTDGKVTTLDGLISNDSYKTIDGKLYLTDEMDNLFISKTKSNIAISTSDVIEEGTRKLIKYGSRKINRNGTRGEEEVSHIPSTKIYRYKKGDGHSENIHNPKLTKELMPVSYEKSGAEKIEKGATGTINITTSVSTNQSNSKNSMNYNNLAEVLVYSNTVGRRTFMNNSREEDEEKHKTIDNKNTISTIPGNALEILKNNGYWDAGHGSNNSKSDGIRLAEIDSDTTEYVTFTEPTGIAYLNRGINKYIIIVLIAMIVIVFLMFALTVWTVKYKKKNQL